MSKHVFFTIILRLIVIGYPKLYMIIRRKYGLADEQHFNDKCLGDIKMKKKILILTIMIVVIIGLVPTIAYADEHTANGTLSHTTFDISTVNDGDIINVSGDVTLTGTKNVQIVCVAGTQLTLHNVVTDASTIDNACALSFTGTGNTLMLEGVNALTSWGSNASWRGEPGVKVESGTELTIDGTGSVTANGGPWGAGIGGGWLQS